MMIERGGKRNGAHAADSVFMRILITRCPLWFIRCAFTVIPYGASAVFNHIINGIVFFTEG